MDDSKLSEIVRQINGRMTQLNHYDDTISKTIKGYQDRLDSCLRVRIQLQVAPDVIIAFGRYDQAWVLLVVVGDAKQVPLLSGSRELRVRALRERWIETLIVAAPKLLDEELAKRVEAIDQPGKAVP